MTYRPEPVDMGEDLPAYLARELLRISAEFDQIAEGRYWTPRAVAPKKPREGMIAVADGTNWNPGSGKGYYEYKSGAWVKF